MTRTPASPTTPLRTRTALAAGLLAGTGILFLLACGGGSAGDSTPVLAAPPSYQLTRLVSDQAVTGAITTDANLVNPWGLAFGPATDFWVANQGTSTTTVYDGVGKPPTIPVIVAIPPIPGHAMGGPTGVTFNGSASFSGDQFIIASLDGCICGWSSGTVMTRRVDNSGSQAVYTGLAVGGTAATRYIYAANLAAGTVDVFDASYAPVHLGTGALVDPTLPAGFSPYNVQVLAGKLFVTYAKYATSALRETPGAGYGYVSVFNLDGTFVQRLASGGLLNAPWGLAIAPADFGPLSGALLVGNFGDGRITAYNPTTGASMGQLSDASGAPMVISGLWGLSFGNGAAAGGVNQLFVTAGSQTETHGLFGVITYGPSGIGTGGGTGTGGGGGLGY